MYIYICIYIHTHTHTYIQVAAAEGACRLPASERLAIVLHAALAGQARLLAKLAIFFFTNECLRTNACHSTLYIRVLYI